MGLFPLFYFFTMKNPDNENPDNDCVDGRVYTQGYRDMDRQAGMGREAGRIVLTVAIEDG